METQLPRETYYEDEDFRIQFTREFDCINVHCDVNRYSPSTVKRGRKIFEQMKQQFKDKILITITPNPKFVKLIGGMSIGSLEYNNTIYEVMTWELK